MALIAIDWRGNVLRLLDQRELPFAEVWHEYRSADEVAQAIREMRVRGAPAIGASAAFGIVIEAKRLAEAGDDVERWLSGLKRAMKHLMDARPTAVNLRWAVERMAYTLETAPSLSIEQHVEQLEQVAKVIFDEDVETNRRIGENGAKLFAKPVEVLTHCNTGSLATAGYGTALGVIRSLHAHHKLKHVWVDETRPYLQGARLTAYELSVEEVPHTLITDSMAGHFMRQGRVDAVLVGADRIARNGDTANKIGTYSLAVLCHHHNIPFYVAAPVNTFDLTLESGELIPIEERSELEVTTVRGQSIAPAGTRAAHPAFDVTPGKLITGIITELGVLAPSADEIVAALHQK